MNLTWFNHQRITDLSTKNSGWSTLNIKIQHFSNTKRLAFNQQDFTPNNLGIPQVFSAVFLPGYCCAKRWIASEKAFLQGNSLPKVRISNLHQIETYFLHMRKWTLHDSSYLVKKLVPRVANPTWPSCKQDYNPFIWDLQIFGLGVQVGFLMNLMRLYWLYVLIVVFFINYPMGITVIGWSSMGILMFWHTKQGR